MIQPLQPGGRCPDCAMPIVSTSGRCWDCDAATALTAERRRDEVLEQLKEAAAL